jgi:hypothetical protein
VYGALIASLSAVTLMFAADETFARSGVTAPHGVVGAPAATVRPPIAPAVRFHNRRNSGVGFPGGGFFYWPSSEFYGPSSEAFADVPQQPPLSNDVRYTYDVPWDWAHRYPPNVVPSDRPYVPSCPSETVTVPGRGGAEHTVNIIRCY